MPYKLIRLAPGSYDVFLDGVVVASLVQARDDRPVWVAELLRFVGNTQISMYLVFAVLVACRTLVVFGATAMWAELQQFGQRRRLRRR